MVRPRKETPWPSPLVPATVRWLRGRGIDPSALLAQIGLRPDVDTIDEAPATTPVIEELLDGAARLAGEPALGLRLATELKERRMGVVELAARTSATVRASLLAVARFAPLLHPSLGISIDEEGDEARFHNRTAGHPRGVGRHLADFSLGRALDRLRAGAGRHVPITRAWFQHARPVELGPAERFFGTRELEFGRDENGFAFPAEALDWPIAAADPRLHATAVDLAEAALADRGAAAGEADFAALVAARIRAALDERGSNPGIELVADALHMSGRTLQRRLEEAGTHFSDLLDGVRESRARELVRESATPLAEIAWRLGFSDLAAFSRAFKRWTGMPPGMMRKRS